MITKAMLPKSNLIGMMDKRKSWDILILLALFSINIILKSLFLGSNNLDIDEPYSISLAQLEFSSLLKVFNYENNPPLFFILLHFWIKFFGIDPFSVRFLSMLFSALTVIFIYLIGKRFYNRMVAIGASLLFTFSNININEAHDTRAYTLVVLLATASMYFYMVLGDFQLRKRNIVALGIVNALMVYSHVFGGFIILIQIFFTISIPSLRKSIIKSYFFSLLILFCLYFPYFMFVLQRLLMTASAGLPFEKSNLSNLHIPFWGFSNYDFKTTALFISLLLVYVLMVFARKKIKTLDIIIFGWLIIPYALMSIISFKIAITNPKYMMFITPGLYLSVMVAIFHISNLQLHINSKLNQIVTIRRIAMFLTFLCIYKMGRTADFEASNYSGITDAVRIIQHNKSDSTLVYITPHWVSLNFAYYYDRDLFKNTYGIREHLNSQCIFPFSLGNEIDQMKVSNNQEVLLLIGEGNGYSFKDPDKKIFNMMVQKFGPCSILAQFPGYVIYHFNPPKSSINN